MPALPTFRYHPDPLATGEITPSEGQCRACGQARGYLYVGPVFAKERVVDELCPWCIADGSAAARFEAHFTDDYGVPRDVPGAVVDEVTTRTPGFHGWQQERWLYHCADAAAYLGRVGYDVLKRHPEAVEMLVDENRAYWSVERCEEYVRQLTADGEATGYLFRCLGCGRYLAYSDMA
ncbi:CbrC family protein [Kribbella sp. NPDC054772]